MKEHPLLITIPVAILLSLLIPVLYRFVAPAYRAPIATAIVGLVLVVLSVGSLFTGLKRRRKQRRWWATPIAVSVFLLIMAACAVFMTAANLNQ